MRTALIFSSIFLSSCLGVIPSEIEENKDFSIIDEDISYFSMCKLTKDDTVRISVGAFIGEEEIIDDHISAIAIETETEEYFLDIEHLDSGDIVARAFVPSTFDCSQRRSAIFMTDL